MAAYLLIEICRVQDPVAYARYVTAARSIVQSHGGHYLLASDQVSSLSDEAPPSRVILIRFADRTALESCFSSAEYRSIAPLRESSTESRAFVIEDN